MDDEERRAAGHSLREAYRSGTAVATLTSTYPGITVDDAYAIQVLNVDARLSDGTRKIGGHKIGLTSGAMQEMFGVHEPDYGHLVDDMFVADGATVEHDGYMKPRAEPEIAFVLHTAIKGPGVTPADVLRATAFVLPAIEIIDTRYLEWKMGLADTIADNASSAGVVLGSHPVNPDAIELRTLGCVLRRNGEIVETGAGGAVLGHPAVAVAWLANALARHGVTLEPGHVVLPGAITRAIDVSPGDRVRAQFDQLGSVSVRFE